jgi:CRISPR/Cas system CSM-associated protein Csm3 (group 7 of RAMP superfamily)
MHHIKLDLTIQFISKWHTGSGEGNFLVQRMLKKDAREWPYIPGSTFRGIARQSCEKLSRTLGFHEPGDPHDPRLDKPEVFGPLQKNLSPVDRLFGSKYEGTNLFFRDLLLETQPSNEAQLSKWQAEQSRIRLYRKLKTVKKGALFTTQYVAPMTFKTSIEGHHDHLYTFAENDPPFAYCLLIAGIMAIDRMGGDKSTGNGQVEIKFLSILVNGKKMEKEEIFDYLDPELYSEIRREA